MTTTLSAGTNDGDTVTWSAATSSWVSRSTNIVSKAADYSLAATDDLCLVSAAATITLPTAVGVAGRVYVVKRTGSGAVVIATTSAQTIDGAATYTIGTQYQCVAVMSDGANWQVI